MKKFIVHASETIFYAIPVTAHDADEAKEMVLSGNCPHNLNDYIEDSWDFEVDEVVDVNSKI